MEQNFSMEWKIFGMEWKWNGRKLPVWNMEKSSSIPYHALPKTAPTLRISGYAPEHTATYRWVS